MPAATDLAPSRTIAWASTVAVAGLIVGLLGDLAHHLGAHILELVLELDLLRHRHAVLGDAWGPEALVDHDIAALRSKRHPHRAGESVDTAQHPIARVR
jgi:hypothetical protein